MSALAERRDLTTGEVWKKLLIFFLPIAAGTCIQQLYNAVDGMVVAPPWPPWAAAPRR